MRPVRSFEAEHAFEEHWARRDEVQALVEVAHRAARRGHRDDVKVCLAKLRQIAPERAEALEKDLEGLLRCVEEHPSRGIP